jgi:hypothetical protein
VRSDITPEAEALIEEIHAAFKGVPRGPLSLHQAAIVKWADERRLADAAKLDKDRSWQGIPDGDIEANYKALNGADPESWRYLLPAFMTWSLRYYRRNQALSSDWTIYSCDPYPAEKSNSLHLESEARYATLNRTQSIAVLHFLEHMAHDPAFADDVVARRAIVAYWRRFRAKDPA